MDDLQPKIDPDELAQAIQSLQELEKEREDIVLGFIKEKEITEKIHNEQLEELRKQHEKEVEALREDFMKDREKLLQENETQQEENNARETKKAEENERKIINKSTNELKESEDTFKNEKRKLRDEYESVITQKTSEIEELYRENCILRAKSEPESFQNENKDAEVLVNKLTGEITTLRKQHDDEIQKLRSDFDFERSEIERNLVREKAEFMKNMTIQFDLHQENNELEKMKSYIKFQNELKEKITIVEELWDDRCNEERNKMNTRFENELEKLKYNHAQELEEKLAERNKTIEDLEQEKDQLLHAIHVERFELAKFYNRELSLLNRLDSSREDIEVALIDEVAKLRDEQQKVIRNMEKRHKRKMNDLKEKQKPMEEIIEQHNNDMENLKRHYEKDREEFEAQLRNEQLTLLKSFEFEKKDIERYYKQVIEDRENEHKEEIQQLQQEHEKEIERMGSLEKENIDFKEKLSELNDKNNELTDRLQEFESQNARLKEQLEKENRGKREQPEEMKGVQSPTDIQRTMEELSMSNIQLANQLANEQKKCEELLKRSQELERLYEEAQGSGDENAEPLSHAKNDTLLSAEAEVTVTTADEVESGPPLADSKHHLNTSLEDDRPRSRSAASPIQKEKELQESLQQYLLELKSIQESLDQKETEIRQVKQEYQEENNRLKQSMQDLKDSIKDIFDGDDEDVDDNDLETIRERHKQIKDIINQETKDNTTEKRDVLNTDQNIKNGEQEGKSDFKAEVDALDNIIDQDLDQNESDKQLKEKANNKLKAVKARILRSHELELLECQQRYEKEQNKYLKELTDEKEADVDISNKVWEAVCEKLGIEGDKSKEKLQELLQKDDPTQKEPSEEKEEYSAKNNNEEELEQLKREKEDLERTIVELEKHFKKEKKRLVKKMEAQHKEIVLSTEAEVIEALTKEKAKLEEAFNIERFNMGRLYYMEMLDELEELMVERKDDIEKEKSEIIFKFNEDIADLLKALADKDKNEVELLKDKNAMARKMISMQRRTNDDDKKLDDNELDDIKSEAEKLDAVIPLKKEIAELQRKRQEEHERNAENLGKAVDVIKDLLSEKAKEQEGKERRFSFQSTGSSYGSTLGAEAEPTGRSSQLLAVGKNTPSDSRASSRSGKTKKSKEPTPTGRSESKMRSSPRDDTAHSRGATPLGSHDQALSPSRSSSRRGATPTSSRDQTSPALSTSRSPRRSTSPGIPQDDAIEEENINNLNADPEQQFEDRKSDKILDEINSKEDLLKAFESLLDNAFAEDKNYESDTSSGAISDFDSEPATPKSEKEEGGNDSGAESIDSERLSIKKSDLELALNLERFGLGRVYYNEYKDSLQDAFRKLAKAKGKSEALENKLFDGVKDLVDRTNFAKAPTSSTEAETQTNVDENVGEPSDTNKKDTSGAVAESQQDPKKEIKDEQKSDKVHPESLKEPTEKKAEKKNDKEKLDEEEQKDIPLDDTTKGEQKDQDKQTTDPATKEDGDQDIKPNDIATGEEKDQRISTDDTSKKEEDQESVGQPSRHDNETIDQQDPATEEQTATQPKVNKTSMTKNVETQTEDRYIENKITDEDAPPMVLMATKEDPYNKISENKPVRKEPVDESIAEQRVRSTESAPDSGVADDLFKEFDTDQKENKDDIKDDGPKDEDNAGDTATESEKDKPAEPQRDRKGDTEAKQSDEPQPENIVTKKEETNRPDTERKKSDVGSIMDILDDETKDLAKEYKKLNDKYNILKALVGKGFVEKIPELNEQTPNEQDDGSNINDDALQELIEEEKSLADDIKSIEKQLDSLRNMSDSNLRDEEKKLNDQELEALKELEKINDQLKKEEDKDLIEHLKNEKAEVEKKLKELDGDLEEKRAQINDEDQNIFDLLKKKLDLESDIAKKAQELDKNHKKLAHLKQEDEAENVEKEIENLKNQEKLLQDLIDSQFPQLSIASKDKAVTGPARGKDATGQSETGTIKGGSLNSENASEQDREDSKDIETMQQGRPTVEDIINQAKEQDRGAIKAAKKLKQAQRDRDRYNRMAEDQAQRLKPFLKKHERLEDALGLGSDQERVTAGDPLSSKDTNTAGVDVNEQQPMIGSKSDALRNDKKNPTATTKTTYSDPKTSRSQIDQLNKGPFQNRTQEPSSFESKGLHDTTNEKDEECLDQVTLPDPKTLQKEHDAIKDALKDVNDQIKMLGDKAKQTSFNPETGPIVDHIKALTAAIEDTNEKISEKRPTLNNITQGKDDDIIDLLEAKAEQELQISDTLFNLPDDFISLPDDVQTAFELACLQNDLNKDIEDLQRDIDEEETCFQEAVQYHREGSLDDSKSPLKEAVQKKAKLQEELAELNIQIADAPDQEDPEILQKMMQNKQEIEQAVEKLQDDIEYMPAKSAEHLSDLIKTKHEKEDELLNTADQLKTAVKELDLDTIPQHIANIITSQNGPQDERASKIKALEAEIQESAAEVSNLYQKQKNPESEEDKLMKLINEHKSIKEQPTLSDHSENDSDFTIPHAALTAQLRKLKDDLQETESKIEAIKDKCSDDEIAKAQDLESLIKEKCECEKEKELFENLLKCLDKKKELEKVLKENKAKEELMEVNDIIDKKQAEIKRLNDNVNELDVLLENLMDEMNNNADGETEIENTIKDTLADIQKQLEVLNKEKEKRKQTNQKAEEHLKEAVSSLEDELEESREELDFVENELEGLHSDPDNEGPLSKDLIDMTALLNSKKSLEDYLLEIDTKLDNSSDGKKESLSQDELDALRAHKRDIENQLADIQEEKSKLEIELQDDEIEETIDALSEEKKQLEAQKNGLLGKIHGANIFSRMAEEMDEEKPSEDDQQYYTHALNEMVAGPKTLIQLAEENEKLKDIACNQRKLLEDLNKRLEDSLGDNLANAIALKSTDKEKLSDIPSPILDRLANQETIQAIVNDLSSENDKLRDMNDEFLNDLESLKDKLGDKLVECILNPNENRNQTALGPISDLITGDTTIQETLEEQNNDLERIEELLGKNLANALKTPTDESSLAGDFIAVPGATEIMKDRDEDLESVLAAYEDKLDMLGRENEALKNMLGNDLAHALLELDQNRYNDAKLATEKPYTQAQDNLPGAAQQGTKDQDDTSRLDDQKPAGGKCDRPTTEKIDSDSPQQGAKVDQGKSKPSVPKRPARAFEKEKEYVQQPSSMKDNVAGLSDNTLTADSKGLDKITGIADVPLKPTKANQIEKPLKDEGSYGKVSGSDDTHGLPRWKHLQQGERNEKLPYYDGKISLAPEALDSYGMEAPIRMAKDNKTLGDVIKGYEDDLDTLKSRLGPGLFDAILAAGKLEDSGEDHPTDSITPQQSVKGASKESVHGGEPTNKIYVDSEGVSRSKPKARDSEESNKKPMGSAVEKRTKPKLTDKEHPKDSYVAEETRQRPLDSRQAVDKEAYPTDTTGTVESAQRPKDSRKITHIKDQPTESTSTEDSNKTPKHGTSGDGDNIRTDKDEDDETFDQTRETFTPVKNTEGTDYLLTVSPKQMIDENKTVEDILNDYAEELQLLKSQIGPELYNCLLETGRQNTKAGQEDPSKKNQGPSYGYSSTPDKLADETAFDEDVHKPAGRGKVPDSKARDYDSGTTGERVNRGRPNYPTKADQMESSSSDKDKYDVGLSGGDDINKQPQHGYLQQDDKNKNAPYHQDEMSLAPKAESDTYGMEAPIRMAKDKKTLGEVVKGYEDDLDKLKSRLGPGLFDAILAADKLEDSRKDYTTDPTTGQQGVREPRGTSKESYEGELTDETQPDLKGARRKSKGRDSDESAQQSMGNTLEKRTKPEVPRRPVLPDKEHLKESSDNVESRKRPEDPRRVVDNDVYPTGTTGTVDSDQRPKDNKKTTDSKRHPTELTSIKDSSKGPEHRSSGNADQIGADNYEDEESFDQTGGTDDMLTVSPKQMMDENKTVEDILNDYAEELQLLKSQIGPELYNCLLETGRQNTKAGKDDASKKDHEPSYGYSSIPDKLADGAVFDENVNKVTDIDPNKEKHIAHIVGTDSQRPSKGKVPDSGKTSDYDSGIAADRNNNEPHTYPTNTDQVERSSKDKELFDSDFGGGDDVQQLPQHGELQQGDKNENVPHHEDKISLTPSADATDTYEIEAPIRMAKDNKTLGEVIKGYEDDFDTLKSRLGPGLFDAILAARKPEDSDKGHPTVSIAAQQGVRKPKGVSKKVLHGEEPANKMQPDSESVQRDTKVRESDDLVEKLMDNVEEKIKPNIPRRPILDARGQSVETGSTLDSNKKPKYSSPIDSEEQPKEIHGTDTGYSRKIPKELRSGETDNINTDRSQGAKTSARAEEDKETPYHAGEMSLPLESTENKNDLLHLPQKKMIDENKTLEDILNDYVEELQTLKSQIGPDLYNCLLDAAKDDSQDDRDNLSKMGMKSTPRISGKPANEQQYDTDKRPGSYGDVEKNIEDEHTRENEKPCGKRVDAGKNENRDKTTEKTTQGKTATHTEQPAQLRRDGDAEPGELLFGSLTNIGESQRKTGDDTASIESGEIIDLDLSIENNSLLEPEMLAPIQMKEQNQTLQDVLKGYERDLDTLKNKLGTDLYNSILDANKEKEALEQAHGDKADYLEKVYDQDLSSASTEDKTSQKPHKPSPGSIPTTDKTCTNIALDEGPHKDEISNVYKSIAKPRKTVNDKDTSKAVDNDPKAVRDRDDDENIRPSYGSAQKEKDDSTKATDKDSTGKEGREDNEEDIQPSYNRRNGAQNQAEDTKPQLKASSLLRDPNKTLQEIIEDYENALDVLTSALGPNLSKAILDSGEKKAGQKDKSEEYPHYSHHEDGYDPDNVEQQLRKTDDAQKLWGTEHKTDEVQKGAASHHEDPSSTKDSEKGIQGTMIDKDRHEGEHGHTADESCSVSSSDGQKTSDPSTEKEQQILLAEKMAEKLENGSTLEDHLQKLEQENEKMKSRLGPNLTMLILDEKDAKGNADKPMFVQGEERKDIKNQQQSSIDSTAVPEKLQDKTYHEGGKLSGIDNKSKEAQNLDELLPNESQLNKDVSDDDNLKAQNRAPNDISSLDDQRTKEQSKKESDSLQNVLLPLLAEDDNNTIEDVMKGLCDDLQTLSEQLGPNLTRNLLRMGSDRKRTPQDPSQKGRSTPDVILEGDEHHLEKEAGKQTKEKASTDKEDIDRAEEKRTDTAADHAKAKKTTPNIAKSGSDAATKDGDQEPESDSLTSETSPPVHQYGQAQEEVEATPKSAQIGSNYLSYKSEDSPKDIDDLDALLHMSDKDQTLEEIIQKYEDTLERYEKALGPHLSKAILSTSFLPDALSDSNQVQPAHQDQSHDEDETNQPQSSDSQKDIQTQKSAYKPTSFKDDQEPDETDKEGVMKPKHEDDDKPPSKPRKEGGKCMLIGDEITQQQSEVELPEKPMKLIEEGKTLEDMVVDYEGILQTLKSAQGDDGEPISLDDITAVYKKQLEDLENKNNEMKKDLDTLEAKLGPNLFKKLVASSRESPHPEVKAGNQNLEGEAANSEEHEQPIVKGTDADREKGSVDNTDKECNDQQQTIESLDDKINPKNKILEEPMKEVNQGKTIEDLLVNYEKERELLSSIQSDDGTPISIDDITAAYKKKIDELEEDNAMMQNDLETLDKKLGLKLANQLKGKPINAQEENDTSKSSLDEECALQKEGLDKSLTASSPSEGRPKNIEEKSLSRIKDDVLQDSDEVTLDKYGKSIDPSQTTDSMDPSKLEALHIMDQYNQPLEEVIADYETQLKEMLTNQEALKTELDTLEQSIGPKLFKALCELKEEQEQEDTETVAEDVKETKQSTGQENEKEDELSKSSDEVHPKKLAKSDFEAINKMNEQEKPLSSVIDDYHDKCDLLEKENESLKKALKNVSGDFDVGEMISNYENKIQVLENENKEAQKQYEEKHNELQNEIKDLRDTLEKLAQTLRQDFLDDLMKQQDTANSIEALQKMEKENKTLAEVVEEYEENMKRLEREKAVLEQLAGQSDEGASILDTISDYEDSINSLKDVNKMLNQRIDALSKKIGPELTEQLTGLCEPTGKDNKKVKDKTKLPAVQEMEDENLTLEDVLKQYDQQNDTQQDEQGLKNLEKNLGKDLMIDLNELDNKSLEELEDEEKSPIALWIMKKRKNNLTDVIILYENYLLQYGVLDTLKGDSLASEIQDVFKAIPVDAKTEAVVCEATYDEPLSSEYGTLGEDELRMTDAEESTDKNNENQLTELQKQLEEERELKEKYQKDVEDLLNDIVKLKLKNASDDEDKEELERQIKEEYETKQENERTKEELAKVKDKNKELEKENKNLKDEIKNMEKEIKRLEKALKEIKKNINEKDADDDLTKKMEDLENKTEELEKEVEDLESKLKENEENFQTEKNKLIDNKDQEKKDTIKDLLKAKADVELQLQEQLSAYHDLEEKLKSIDDASDKEDDEKLKEMKMRNESLKEQLDHAEEAMRQALEKYQEQIKNLETENAKVEEKKKHEIELLNNKLELEKNANEKLKDEQEEMLKKAKDKLQEEFENDLERERRKMKKDLEEQLDDLERLRKKHEQELNDLNDQSRKEKNDLNNLFEKEKQKLMKDFDEKMKEQNEEHENELAKLREEMEDKIITVKAELNVQFNQEKAALQAEIEKNLFGDEIQKNLDLESDFQGTLNKVLEEHATEIEDIDREMKQADKDFQEEKNKLLKAFEKEREKDNQKYDKLRLEMESNIENMLKEIIKLKHQRKEMRQQHRIEKQNMEELFESERNEIQAAIERSKNELLTKLTEEHEKEMEHEREKYDEIIKDLQETLDKSEARKKELEEKLRIEELKAEESKLNNATDEKSHEVQKEIKVIKRSIEVEYEKKLSVEKQRFEETLQGLRREVGSLQEKRKIIQERVYNQEGSYTAEKHVIEKSIANYKMEVLAKLEGEMAQRLNKERRPLEEEIKELQTENEELKRERWEMKVQFRREKTSIEEKYEKEKETMEQSFNKEREEMRKRLEATLQKQEKVNRISGTSGEALSSPRVDNSVRMLQQENLSLVTHNARLEADVERLTEKLESIEGNFKEMVMYEKTKAERFKQIQDEMPKKSLFQEMQERPVPEYQLPSASAQDQDQVFQSLQEKDQQIHRLLETKRYYETVLGELCDEAGLFELDRNEVV